MITKEVYLKALGIVEAYHIQIRLEALEIKEVQEKPKQQYKNKEHLNVGDAVECVEVHGNSKGNLTIGKEYPVKRINGHYFYVENDQGKIRHYSFSNSQFRALN
ncbi:hypothetical protein [Flavobacterium sp. 3-210]